MVERVELKPKNGRHRSGPLNGRHAEAQRYANSITAEWQRGPQSNINTGKLLIEAKKSLFHGEWLWMLKHGSLPFGERTAQMLMQIAEHAVISNPKYISYLPPSWSMLYALTRLPDPVLEEMISDGT